MNSDAQHDGGLPSTRPTQEAPLCKMSLQVKHWGLEHRKCVPASLVEDG